MGGRTGRERPIASSLATPRRAEFGVAAERGRRATPTAILGHPDGARFFVGPQILWSGNEVSVSDAGDVLRIDRLVQLDEGDGAVWWVLDYKLHHAPESLAPYRAQLLRYRERRRAGAAG